MGLHSLDAIYMVIQAVTSIGLAYAGGLLWGMPGIFIGLLIPLIILTTVRKGLVISENALGMKSKDYLVFCLLELIKISATISVAVLACSFIKLSPSLMSFFVKGIIAVVIGILLPCLFSFRTKEFDYTLSLIRKIQNKLFHKS